MCLILFSYQINSSYPLIVASNRDEFYARPTKEVYFWEDNPNILAGRDLQEMGTWMGITKTGKFAALTNYRDPNELVNNPRSRGEIVSNFLNSEMSILDYINVLDNSSHSYRGYNVLLYDQNDFYYFSNVSKAKKKLDQGIYGLSNEFLDTPWPKVVKGKLEFEKCLHQKQLDRECLFSVLANNDVVQDEYLPNTGVGIEWERRLSPLFIKSPDYGTRASTVLTINDKNEVYFKERSFVEGKQFNKNITFKMTPE